MDSYDDGLIFTQSKKEAEIVLLGSKSFNINEFPNLKGIFRAGISKDNVPEKEAKDRGVIVRFPSTETIDIIYQETSSFTCNLIFKMLYSYIGTLDPWIKQPRRQLSKKILLVIGTGKIGKRVAESMKKFLDVKTFDIIDNKLSELKPLMIEADCISLHIPKNDENESFINEEKLSWMKKDAALINTSRGAIVDENALYKEIQSGRLIAAFDVYWQEPYLGKLKEFYPDKFYMTPHVASTCDGFLKGCRNDLHQLIDILENNSN